MDTSKTVCYKEPANFLKKISASVKKITENWSLVQVLWAMDRKTSFWSNFDSYFPTENIEADIIRNICFLKFWQLNHHGIRF